MWATVAPGREDEALRGLYHKVPATDFSREVLSTRASDLGVIRARDLGWSDLGEPERALSLLRLKGAPANGEGQRMRNCPGGPGIKCRVKSVVVKRCNSDAQFRNRIHG